MRAARGTHEGRMLTRHTLTTLAPIRALTVATTIAVAAAAVPAQAQTPSARAILPGIESPILLDTLGLPYPIHGNRDAIFTAIEGAFKELKIPVETRDPKSGMPRNLNAEVTRRLGNEALSRYLDCGRGFSGNNADFYRITLAISTWVERATGEPQKLLIAIAASGRDPAGSRSAYPTCTSRGALERRIADRVQALVAAPTPQ